MGSVPAPPGKGAGLSDRIQLPGLGFATRPIQDAWIFGGNQKS